jgi:hypothetical protein
MKISPLAILCAHRAVFFAAVNVDVSSVDAADVIAGRSDTSTSRLIKPTSFLSKFQVDLETSIRSSDDDEVSRPDDLEKSLNVASAVTVTRNFLSKDETALFRHNENKYQRMPAVHLSGNRMWGGAYLPRSFLHKLVDVGAQQCASEDYENTLPAGVHILTNHVTETTDPHVDYKAITSEPIKNDVAVVFLNSNPDATFYVEDEGYPVEEGMLITFPGGSVPHHIEMKKEDGGFVHMLGLVEIGGSHGTVGQVVQVSRNLGKLRVGSEETQTVEVNLGRTVPVHYGRMLEVDDSEQDSTTTSSTTQQYGTNNITGYISVTGYRDGIDSNGATNHTLEVAYRLEGLGSLNCSAVNCFSADIIKNQPNFCSSAKIGQIVNDELSDQGDNSTAAAAESYTFLDLEVSSLLDDIGQDLSLMENLNIEIPDVVEGVVYINIGKPVVHFFDAPMALYDQDGRMLACSVFTEAEVKAAAEEDTTSDASSYRAAMWTIMAVFVSSAVALINSL